MLDDQPTEAGDQKDLPRRRKIATSERVASRDTAEEPRRPVRAVRVKPIRAGAGWRTSSTTPCASTRLGGGCLLPQPRNRPMTLNTIDQVSTATATRTEKVGGQ